MASLIDIYNLLTGDESARLFARTEAAVMKLANYVTAEPDTVPNHAARLAWAQYALQSRANLVAKTEQMFLAVCSNGTIQNAGGNATDNDIDYVVGVSLNIVATDETTAAQLAAAKLTEEGAEWQKSTGQRTGLSAKLSQMLNRRTVD